MVDRRLTQRPPDGGSRTLTTPLLFAWRGGEIVLLGERSGGRWVVARGWRDRDRLCDVRRWSFGDARSFARQVRRLAMEATGDRGASRVAGEAAAVWSAAE